MRITGDEGGVRSLKVFYSKDKNGMLGYLQASKHRGVAYYRVTNSNRYLLYEIRCEAGDTFTVTKFQEGSLEPPP
ncbi:MAG: hypothetical protein A2161_17775 [Candidatus Schekmanbacteria bacterium RBG_13_48_7]|uniref:Uncharacterized protein n=1 Tax=Candidatus Schekmanbacteria bacterium RBG_13_48_7 TaxID=1817878 RepID=A0A1F7S978_9BACT|nr:MAG: hypothetical protein A2161_17775 [Candidatus Schekmanbacteria bacterium RBG_13_48_7]